MVKDARGKVNYLQNILRVPIILHEALINLVNEPPSAGIVTEVEKRIIPLYP
jgi:hypothetical protein